MTFATRSKGYDSDDLKGIVGYNSDNNRITNEEHS